MAKCWIVRYDDSRFTIREFGIPSSLVISLRTHFHLIREREREREYEHEYEHEALTRYMCLMMLSPNSLHLISVAPSIKRAKS